MTQLAAEKARKTETWKLVDFTLTSGTKAYKGGRAALSLSTGKVLPATTATTQFMIGVFAKTVDATAAEKIVTVDLEKEIQVECFANATAGDAVATTDVGSICYQMDDATVTITSTGRSISGRVWRVDSYGVWVEKLQGSVATSRGPNLLLAGAAGSFTANDWAPTAAALGSSKLFAVPTTGAASTITLPADAEAGTVVYFVADGTANGHTVQYRDATGPTNLTTALTASKRHLVVATKLNTTIWAANAYVSP